MDIQALLTAQRAYFSTGATLPLSTRKGALKRLRILGQIFTPISDSQKIREKVLTIWDKSHIM